MRHYVWSGLDHTGMRRRGTQRGKSAEDVRRELATQGIAVMRVRPSIVDGLCHQVLHLHRLSDQHRATFFTHLGVLLRSGLPLTTALEALSADQPHRELQRVLVGVTDAVKKG